MTWLRNTHEYGETYEFERLRRREEADRLHETWELPTDRGDEYAPVPWWAAPLRSAPIPAQECLAGSRSTAAAPSPVDVGVVAGRVVAVGLVDRRAIPPAATTHHTYGVNDE